MAIEFQIDVLFIDNLGMPIGRVWSVKYGSISNIRQKQVEFLFSNQVNTWVKQLLSEKINNQIALLFTLIPSTENNLKNSIQKSINSMQDHQSKIDALQGEHISDIAPTLRGWEGAAAKRYFQAISLALPLPYQFSKRSFNPAQDFFNAALNYGYGILYGKVESALIKAGIDPYMGVFHRDDYNRPALVFDIIEKYRIWIDYVIIQLFTQNAFIPECFNSTPQGVWLEGLGKRIVVQSINDYLSEIILKNNLQRSRANHIENDAHNLAQFFLNHG